MTILQVEVAGLRARAEQVRDRALRLQAACDQARATVASSTIEEQDLSLEDEILTEALSVVAGLTDAEVRSGFSLVENLLREAMRVVFADQQIGVEARVGQERGRIAVDVVTSVPCEGGRVEGQASDLFGGSITTIQAVFLRVACILRRGLRRFMVLDETLAPLDEAYARAFAGVFADLCRRLHFDVLVITHSHALWEASPRRYRVVRGARSSRLVLDRGVR